jgi:fatty-acyl-CoA synthase
VPGADYEEVAVMVVQCNINNPAESHQLTQRLHREIHEELGINCLIELVPRHTLPRTSSGKLSRSAARADYLLRQKNEKTRVAVEVASEAELSSQPEKMLAHG